MSQTRFYEELTIAHEIGHQGGGEHTDLGIMVSTDMDEYLETDLEHFSPVTIRRFRQESTF